MTPVQLQFAIGCGQLLVTVLGLVATWGVVRGTMTRAIREHDQKFRELHEEQANQWRAINASSSDVSEVRGVLGMSQRKAAAAHGGGD